jgi:hypothetical protein
MNGELLGGLEIAVAVLKVVAGELAAGAAVTPGFHDVFGGEAGAEARGYLFESDGFGFGWKGIKGLSAIPTDLIPTGSKGGLLSILCELVVLSSEIKEIGKSHGFERRRWICLEVMGRGVRVRVMRAQRRFMRARVSLLYGVAPMLSKSSACWHRAAWTVFRQRS